LVGGPSSIWHGYSDEVLEVAAVDCKADCGVQENVAEDVVQEVLIAVA
jgi:hypothetical protein